MNLKQIKTRQIALSKLLQMKAKKFLKDLDPTALKFIKEGYEAERNYMTSIKKFCRACGSPLKRTETSSVMFDEHSGKKVVKVDVFVFCPNAEGINSPHTREMLYDLDPKAI